MMNPSTLKESYRLKKINEISKRVKRADYVLNESNVSYHTRLLLEALDEDEYSKATATIEKLQGLSKAASDAGLKSISTAIDTSVKEINKYTGGGIDRVKSKLAAMFSKSSPDKNPILKGLSFASALEKGLGALPSILKNNIKELEQNKAKPVKDLLTDPNAQKTFAATIQKAFVPEGTFGKIFGKIPYINDVKTLVDEIMESTPEKLAAVIKPAAAGPQAADVDPQIADPKANAAAAKELGQGGAGQGDKAGDKGAAAQGTPGAAPGKAPEGKGKETNVRATQDNAKKAGIKDAKQLQVLLDDLGYEVGSLEGSLVVPELQKLMRKTGLDEDQADGFIRGLMSDFDKDFKPNLEKAINAEVEKRRKELEGKGGGGKPAPSGGGGTPAGGGGQGGGGGAA